ncbi:MAG: DUF5615 family PIN-like protein [Bacteroidetes bacterium]|nr:DUF5615 family PIN-like protein [Bacteroidota bacterium]
MKLLIDENLAPSLAESWQSAFPGTAHVRGIGLGNTDDRIIWDHAKENDFTIITKDSDFEQRSFLLGSPPKVIWVRSGNRSTAFINLIVLQHVERIQAFGDDAEAALLVLP